MSQPRIEILSPVEEEVPCVLRGTLPPGAEVPLHSHPDPETFVVVEGRCEGCRAGDGWTPIGAGEAFHVASGVRHSFRNRGREPAVSIVVTTARLGRFFTELGDRPTPEHLRRTAEKYGHWIAPAAGTN